MRLVAVVLGILFVPTLAEPQDPLKPLPNGAQAPAFPTRVDVVTVDAVVVDRKGNAVPGLTREEFTIFENGVPQQLTSFEAVSLPPFQPGSGGEPRRAPYSSNVEQEAHSGRAFVVVFDDVHLSPLQAHRAKAVVGEFLRTGVRAGDRVTLISTAGGTWWNALMPGGAEALTTILKRLDGRFVAEASPDRITDFEAMRIMVYDDPDVGYQVKRRFDAYGRANRDAGADRQYADTLRTGSSNVGLIDPYVRARAMDAHEKAVSRRKITMGSMTRALRSLQLTRGRKAMILVSQGFIHEPDFPEMKDLVEASLRVNVPVYFVDTRGLEAMPDFMTAAFGRPFDVQDTVAVLADITRDAEGAEAVALDTGGFAVRNTNDLTSAMLRVSSESLSYYLLGYSPGNGARDGKFRRIEVKLSGVNAKGLKVRARRGYYAPREGARAGAASKHDPEMVQALDSPFERGEVPIRVAAFSFDETLSERTNLHVVTEIDMRGLTLREENGRFKDALAFLVELQHRETGEYYRIDETIDMALLPETRRSLDAGGYTVSREFALPSGGYQAKVVVRDAGSGRIGSVIHDFEVPALDTFRLTSPILADALESQDAVSSRQPRPLLRVRRSFAQGSTLYVQYSVLGAKRDEATRVPQVSSGYEIRRSDGQVLKSGPATRIKPTSLGALIRLVGIRLPPAEPGAFELVLRVKDELAGSSLEVREPFEIEGPAAPTAVLP